MSTFADIMKRLAKLDALNKQINGPRASAPAVKAILGKDKK